MDKKVRRVAAGEFKSRCLKMLDDVARTGRPIEVSKRGKPVALVVPIEPREPVDLRGSVRRYGDVLSPVDEPWDVTR